MPQLLPIHTIYNDLSQRQEQNIIWLKIGAVVFFGTLLIVANLSKSVCACTVLEKVCHMHYLHTLYIV